MIAICISVLCAILIFTTWRLELLARKTKKLENELFMAQVKLKILQDNIDCKGE
jgi:hypothetical protein